MSLLLSSTLANPTTPYYALAGAGGGAVSSVSSSSSNIIISPSTGAVVVSLSGVVTTNVAPYTLTSQWYTAPYPANVATGTDVTTRFFVNQTGNYLLTFNAGFNVGPSAVSNTGSDFIQWGLVGADSGTIAGAASFFPVNMGAGGNDYGYSTSSVVTLLDDPTPGAGGYYIFRCVSTGSTLSLGEASSSVSVKITPLC